jgi:hypothetical protein
MYPIMTIPLARAIWRLADCGWLFIVPDYTGPHCFEARSKPRPMVTLRFILVSNRVELRTKRIIQMMEAS